MKKSLITLAVLAASSAAMAQSSVTVYGRVDASVGNEKTTERNASGVVTNELSKNQQFNGSDAGLTGSRWGLLGTEDLGGGLKAVFKLENRFSVDTGASADPYFSGDAYVGLSGNFGTVKFGRTYSVLDDVRALAVSQNVFDSAFTPTSSVYRVKRDGTGTSSSNDYSSKSANMIRYESPVFNGFSFGVNFAMDEKLTDADITKNGMRSTGLMLRYKQGPLEVALGHSKEDMYSTPASNVNDRKYTALSAAYDFGVVRVSGGYNRRSGDTQVANNATITDGKDSEYTLGVTMPMGAFAFSGGYASSTVKEAGATVAKASGFGLGMTYSLSKRTRLYAGYRDYATKDSAGVKRLASRLYAAGIRHDF